MIFAVKVVIETSGTDASTPGAESGLLEEVVVVAVAAGETDKIDVAHPHPEIIEVE